MYEPFWKHLRWKNSCFNRHVSDMSYFFFYSGHTLVCSRYMKLNTSLLSNFIIFPILKNFNFMFYILDSTFFPERCADVMYKGEKIGTLGILHPEVILEFDLLLPCSCLEINIEPFVWQHGRTKYCVSWALRWFFFIKK